MEGGHHKPVTPEDERDFGGDLDRSLRPPIGAFESSPEGRMALPKSGAEPMPATSSDMRTTPRGSGARDWADDPNSNPPVQVCPHCDYSEPAKRLYTPRRSGWWRNRTVIEVTARFRSSHCPVCGSLLAKKCPFPDCGERLTLAADRRCRSCGRGYPWANRLQGGRGTQVLWRRTAQQFGDVNGTRIWTVTGDISP
jgi:hypothetical protein